MATADAHLENKVVAVGRTQITDTNGIKSSEVCDAGRYAIAEKRNIPDAGANFLAVVSERACYAWSDSKIHSDVNSSAKSIANTNIDNSANVDANSDYHTETVTNAHAGAKPHED